MVEFSDLERRVILVIRILVLIRSANVIKLTELSARL